MKVIDAKVSWLPGYANQPTFEVLMDELPTCRTVQCQVIKHNAHSRTFVGVRDDGAAHLYSDDNNRAGFGGAMCDVTLDGGIVLKVEGPWLGGSPSSGDLIDRVLMEANATTNPVSLAQGYTLQVAALSWTGMLRATIYAGVTLLLERATEAPEPLPPFDLTDWWDSRGTEARVLDYLRENNARIVIGTPFGPKPSSNKQRQWTPLVCPPAMRWTNPWFYPDEDTPRQMLRGTAQSVLDNGKRFLEQQAILQRRMDGLRNTLLAAARAYRDEDDDSLRSALAAYIDEANEEDEEQEEDYG